MDSISVVLGEVASVALTVLIPVLVAMLGSAFYKFIITLKQKSGLEVDKAVRTEIQDLIMKVVVMVNQTIVDDMKSHQIGGKLTEDQKANVFNITKSAIEACLTQEQIRRLIDQYVSVDNALDILIEATVAKAKDDKKKKTDLIPELPEETETQLEEEELVVE